MAKQPAKGRKATAKPANTTKSGDNSTESTLLLVDAIPPEVHAKAAPAPAAKTETPANAAKPIAPPKPEPAATKPEPKPEPAAKPVPAAAKTPPQQGSRFLPLAFGGLVAGGIGFLLGTQAGLGTDTGLADRIDAQGNAIAALERQIADQPAPDLSGIEDAQADLAGRIEAVHSELNAALSDLDERTTALEQLPRGEGIASVPAIAAYEAQLDDLRAQIDEMTNIAVTQLDAARAEAAAIEENAAAAARAAAGRAALARIQTALESGAPIGAALGDLEEALGQSAPDALIAAEDGVPTLQDLQEQFPEYARAALSTARREGVAGEETTGFGAFLRNQFEVRSVAPREGSDSDAILSRAEASLRAGRLYDALAEIAGLPEVARAEMSEWLALAETRAAAIDAVDILSTSLIDN